MQSILIAHYCFSAEIITMKNKAEYWLRVFVFFLSSSLYTSASLPPQCFSVLFIQKVVGCGRGKQAVSLRASNHLYCRQVGVYHLRDGVCSSLKGGKSVFNCFICKWVTTNQRICLWKVPSIRSTGVRQAAEWWWAAAFNSFILL